jgi:hypothetical protein
MPSTLVTDPNAPIIYTANRETDARTSLTRGLAEYLEGLTTNAQGGRQIQLRRVYSSWAEPEDEARYPAAYVSSPGEGQYDASRFTPTVDHTERIAQPDGRYVVHLAEFVATLAVEVWANDPQERMQLAAAIEDAFNPLDYRYGMLLDLPHYYGLRADYAVQSMRYQDTEVDAMRRYRLAIFTLTASVPVVRLRAYAEGRPRAIVDVSDSSVILSVSDR